MDVFKNGGLGYLAGFLILSALIVAIVLVISSSGESSSIPKAELEWVAVGKDSGYGNIMYSNDGKTWTKTSTGDSFSTEGFGVAYGTCNGVPLWVAVGDGSGDGNNRGNIMYSTDGKSWTKTSTGDSFNYFGNGVAYGTSNGTSPLWVAVGDESANYGSIMYSSDGKRWTKTSTGEYFDTGAFGVAYGTSNGTSRLWVAVGQDNSGNYGNIMYSENGQSWTKTSTGDSFNSTGNGVAYGTSDGNLPLWVAVGEDSGRGYENIMHSSDGKRWTKTSAGDSFGFVAEDVAYKTVNGTPLWVAVGYDNSGGPGVVMHSNNGKTWTKTSIGDSFSNIGRGVAAKHLLYGMDPNYYHPQ